MKAGDKIKVALPIWAEYTVRVEVTDEMIDDDGDVDYDAVMDEAYSRIPSGLCHHCSTGNSGAGWLDESQI